MDRLTCSVKNAKQLEFSSYSHKLKWVAAGRSFLKMFLWTACGGALQKNYATAVPLVLDQTMRSWKLVFLGCVTSRKRHTWHDWEVEMIFHCCQIKYCLLIWKIRHWRIVKLFILINFTMYNIKLWMRFSTTRDESIVTKCDKLRRRLVAISFHRSWNHTLCSCCKICIINFKLK